MFRYLFFLFSIFSLQAQEYILGIGGSVVDLFLQVDDAFLSQQALRQKGKGAKVTPEEITRIVQARGVQPTQISGGSAANVIKTLARLGESCRFYTHRGPDLSGIQFKNDMARYGVNEWAEESNEYETGQALSLVTPDGQSTLLSYEKRINDGFPSDALFQDVKWIHLEAYALDRSDYVHFIIDQAKAKGIKISLDLSSADIVQRHKKKLFSLIDEQIDILFCTEEEALALTGFGPMAACRYLQNYCPVAVVTQGLNGCIVGQASRFIEVPGFMATTVDSTGSKDLFAGGFLYGYLNGYSLTRAAEIGNRLAAYVSEVIGAELSDETWTEVFNYLNEG